MVDKLVDKKITQKLSGAVPTKLRKTEIESE